MADFVDEISGLPSLVVANEQGEVFEVPELKMVGQSVHSFHLPEERELIRIPYGSDLFVLENRVPLGYDPERGELVRLETYRGKRVLPVAAFMAPAHTWIYRAAYETLPNAPDLPLYAYTAVGWRNEAFWVAGVRVDDDVRQDPAQFNPREIERAAERMLVRYSNNRLVRHLVENCVRRYGCPAARNFVLERWECPVPTSPGCNANCVGCLSYQPPDSFSPAQERIDFVPTVEEIVEFTVPHLEGAPNAVVSFGQGCEGEPLTVADVIEAAIREMRKRTEQGTINVNTNASDPEAVERLCKAGLDSIRVSLNSAQRSFYERYFRPLDYSFEDVLESIRVAKRHGCWVSLNYFVFPGFTDHPDEMAALFELVETYHVDMIQARNLNLDPEVTIRALQLQELDDSDSVGVLTWLDEVRARFPWVRIGYFNPAVRRREGAR